MVDFMIEITRDAGVATITLRRPEAKNALTLADFTELEARLREVANCAEDRVLILTGAGDAFCSGADLSGSPDAAARLAEGPVGLTGWVRTTTAAALALHQLPKPTIAAVNGVAAGGGCNLALGCDLVFAAASARFVQIFVNRGLALDYAGSWLLPRLVGLQRAKDLAFRGDPVSAEEALAMGLVLEVVPDDALLSRVTDYAQGLAAKPPVALALIKRGLDRATHLSFEEALEYEIESQAVCMGTEDFREAMSAWLQKRNGEYHGR
ncbi:MAG: enoyl-CoA hydratase-related protein [Myxococcota bacterium]